MINVSTHKPFSFIVLILLFACNNNANTEVNDEDASDTTKQEAYISSNELIAKQWLVGAWKDMSNNPKGQSHEIWHIDNEGLLQGKEFFVKPNLDTSKIAYNRIEPYLGGFQFLNITKETKQTSFRLKTQTENSMHFENPSHSWPQSITYNKITSDSLTITLDGYVFESQRTLVFKMKRYAE
jgi:hypothetical protein